MSLNIFCTFIFFTLQIVIGFFLAPFILKNLGQAAYGFLVFCNSIISWGYIFSSLINVVASRFIAIEFNKNKMTIASEIYSSTLLANIVFSICIMILSFIFIFKINMIFDIDENLIKDVRITFLLYSLNFILGLFNAVLSIHTFVLNKMYLISIRQAFGTILIAIFIFCLYMLFTAHIFYAPLSALLSSLVIFLSLIYLLQKLKNTIHFKFSLFKMYHIKNLASSGFLNSIQTLSNMLLQSMDLLLVGAFLGAEKMGILALSKTFTIYMSSFIINISNNFMPKLMQMYSQNDNSNLISHLFFYIRLLCFISLTPMAVFLVLCPDFYALWLKFKSLDETLFISQLAMILAIPAVLLSCMYPLILLNIITNKQKRASIAMILLAIFTCCLQVLTLKYNCDLFVVLLVASILYCIKIIFFDISNAGILLNLNKFYFMKEFIKNFTIFVFLLMILYFCRGFLSTSSWINFIFSSAILTFISYAISFVFIFNKKERILCIQKILSGKNTHH